MVWWLFKKKGDNQVDPEAIKNSFSNIKHDMNHISSWINHFKGKHEEHKSNHQELTERVEKLEQLLASKQIIEETVEVEEQETTTQDIPQLTPLEDMSLVERKVCTILNSLQKENGGSWVPMRKLAEESYPQKEYKDSRSHVSQLISKLELDGFITKKRMGKYVYVHLNKEKKPLFNQTKVKEKNKKKNVSKKK